MHLSFGKLSLLESLEVSVEANRADNLFLNAFEHLKSKSYHKE